MRPPAQCASKQRATHKSLPVTTVMSGMDSFSRAAAASSSFCSSSTVAALVRFTTPCSARHAAIGTAQTSSERARLKSLSSSSRPPLPPPEDAGLASVADVTADNGVDPSTDSDANDATAAAVAAAADEDDAVLDEDMRAAQAPRRPAQSTEVSQQPATTTRRKNTPNKPKANTLANLLVLPCPLV